MYYFIVYTDHMRLTRSGSFRVVPDFSTSHPVSISEKTSYRKISRSLKAARFVFRIVRSLWNLTGTLAALLPMCLSNFKAIRQFKVPISWLWDFTRSDDKTSFRILRRGPAGLPDISVGPPPGDDVRDASRRLLYFYWKPVTGPKYFNGRAILRPNVEINCNYIFMRHIFWSTWNAKVIAQSPAITTANGKKWWIAGGWCWEKIVFHGL